MNQVMEQAVIWPVALYQCLCECHLVPWEDCVIVVVVITTVVAVIDENGVERKSNRCKVVS